MRKQNMNDKWGATGILPVPARQGQLDPQANVSNVTFAITKRLEQRLSLANQHTGPYRR